MSSVSFSNTKGNFENLKSTFIIAEAGVNHNGNMDLAYKLIDAAAEAGVDAIKFQTFKTENLVLKTAQKAEYQINNTGNNETQFEMLKKLELTIEDFKNLKDYSERKGLVFLSTPFDFQSVDLLEDIGLSIYKISSTDINNIPFIEYIAEKGKPIILSTGMSSLSEIEEAVLTIRKHNNSKLIVLHCNTNYPTAFEEVNMKAMLTIKNAFNVEVGYSDHTMGVEIPIMAVSLGAKVIEKHFTLDKSMEGPDHKASLDPNELKYMVNCIRNIEKAFGDGIKCPTESELKNEKVMKKSVVTTKNIRKGEVFTLENITLKRPGTGLEPRYLKLLLGRKANKDYNANHIITLDDILE